MNADAKRYRVRTNKYSHEGSGYERTALETEDLNEAIAHCDVLAPHQRWARVEDIETRETVHRAPR